MKNSISIKCHSAYSLVEILTIVGVIGLISAIAVPAVSRIWESAQLASARRNAQQAVAISTVADAAGIVHVVPELAGGITATLEILSSGVTGTSETGVPIMVQLRLSEQEIIDASQFLKLRYSGTAITLEYDPKY